MQQNSRYQNPLAWECAIGPSGKPSQKLSFANIQRANMLGAVAAHMRGISTDFLSKLKSITNSKVG